MRDDGILRAARLSLLLCVALLVVGLVTPVAHARPGHKVPDIRRAPVTRELTHRVVKVPLTVHVTNDRGHGIIRTWRVRKWVERANRALRPHGIEIEVKAVRRLPSDHGRITRWRHRRDLAVRAPRDGSIHVFIVDRLELFSTRRGDRAVRGMHWRYRGFRRDLSQREYVVVTSDAPRTTLAHELGHLFGLRHDARTDNLMCSCRRGPEQMFTPMQGSDMRRGAGRFMHRQRRR